MSTIVVIYKEPDRIPEMRWTNLAGIKEICGADFEIIRSYLHPGTVYVVRKESWNTNGKKNIFVNGSYQFGPVFLSGYKDGKLISLPGVVQRRFQLRQKANLLSHSEIGI